MPLPGISEPHHHANATSATIRRKRRPKTHKTPLTRPFHRGLNYVLTVFKNFREEIEAAKTLLFGLSAGAGVSALSGSSFQSIPSASLKMTSAQSSQAPVVSNTSRLNSKRAGSESDSDSEDDDDLGFGESDYFHDNKYGKHFCTFLESGAIVCK